MKEALIGIGIVVLVAALWAVVSEYFFGDDGLDDYEDEV